MIGTGKPASRTRGFTLIEVLVALAIMAVLSTMAWKGMDALMRSRDINQGHLERSLRLNTALAQFEADLAAAFDTPIHAPGMKFDGATLRITRRAQQDAGPGSRAGVQLVAWMVEDGHWQRWASPIVNTGADLDAQWQASANLATMQNSLIKVMPEVSSWQVYFFQGNAWANAQSSGDVTTTRPANGPASSASSPQPDGNQPQPSSGRPAMPEGVRIVLSVGQAADNSPAATLTRDITMRVGSP